MIAVRKELERAFRTMPDVTGTSMPELRRFQEEDFITNPVIDGVVVVDTPRELYRALQFAYAELGCPSDPKRVVGHEREHAFAARALGMTSIKYVLQAANKFDLNSGEWLGTYTMASLVHESPPQTTLLEYAAISAFPREPSRGDLQDLADMGYEVDKVGFEALRHNAQGQNLIPVPLSYRPAATVIPLS